MNRDEVIDALIQKSKVYLKTAKIALDFRDYCSSVSRSYYAIFSAIRALLLEKGITPKTHKGTLVKFSEEYIKTGIFPSRYSKILARAQRLRERGDYGTSINVISKEDAEELLKDAQNFIKEAEIYIKRIHEITKSRSNEFEISL